jgi:hypothetical protein
MALFPENFKTKIERGISAPEISEVRQKIALRTTSQLTAQTPG